MTIINYKSAAKRNNLSFEDYIKLKIQENKNEENRQKNKIL